MKKALAIAILVGLLSPAFAETLYGDDLAARLAGPREIREATSIRSKLRKVMDEAPPLFVLTPMAFSDVEVAPDITPIKAEGRPKQWELPPFSSVPPALPPDTPESVRREIEEANRQPPLPTPAGFTEIPIEVPEIPHPMTRPKALAPGEEFVFRIKEMPEPFSVRRYFESDEDVFFQISAYGGTTSWKAEEAYRAIKECATRQDPLEGVGAEAFLTRVVVIDPRSLPAEGEDAMNGPALPAAPPFAEIEPEDEARPDLLDSGKTAAMSAPAFSDLAVADLEGKTIAFSEPPKKYTPKGGKVKQSLIVLVAFFKDESLTVTFAIEERLGNVQDLVDVALLAQKNLKEDIVAKD